MSALCIHADDDMNRKFSFTYVSYVLVVYLCYFLTVLSRSMLMDIRELLPMIKMFLELSLARYR